ncbi:MAG: DUF3800 domain-containing protein [Proteobacteria bacterium]|nr:DUF3800 domain-containing protein [Pseudomonadota bacterium]
MITFYMDEAGYTGYDLLNADQRFQGASALCIDDETAKSLIAEYFPSTQSPELKHRQLSRRKTYWKPLLALQRRVLRDHMSFTYVCDKRYLLTLMLLNSCVEPAFHDHGLDFYQDGHNYGLASLLYKTGPTLWGKSDFDDLLNLFQRAQRTKTDQAIHALVEHARSLRNRELTEYLWPLAANWPSCIHEIQHPKTSTDAALVVLLALVAQIEKFAPDSYQVVHDTSANLRQYNQFLSQLAACDVNIAFHETQITSLRFPLKLKGVTQVDSRQSAAVQLADLLVGGMIEHAMSLVGKVEKNDYNQQVLGLYGDTNLIHLLPDLDFEANRRFRAGTHAQALIDFFAKQFG